MRVRVVDRGAERAVLEREGREGLELERRVAGKLVHRDDGVEAELLHDPQVRGEVLRSALERREAAVRVAAVPLQGLRGRDEHDRVGRKTARPADDVDELLEAEVAPEAPLGDDVVRELEPDEIADERAVAVRDVRERPGVHEGRLALERLHEVRLDRVFQEDGHRPGDLEVLGGHRSAFEARRDGDRAQAVPEIVAVAGHGEHAPSPRRRP